MMTFVSLFAGIGGMDLGLERAGMKCIAQVEIDEFCRRVLSKNWPDVPKFSDVRDFNRGSISETPTLICGGFPCQDISNAGKRAGIDGERSGLWSEYHRIICDFRPRIVLVENVAALLVRGVDRVLGDLAASGYDAQWDCIPAAAVGAPHRRDRLYIVAYAARVRCEQRGVAAVSELGSETIFADSRRAGASGTDVAHAERCGREPARGGLCESGARSGRRRSTDGGDKVPFTNAASIGCGAGRARRSYTGREGQQEQTLSLAGFRRANANGWWATEPAVGRVANGVPDRVDRLRGLGNAVVPQVAEWIGKQIIASFGEES